MELSADFANTVRHIRGTDKEGSSDDLQKKSTSAQTKK